MAKVSNAPAVVSRVLREAGMVKASPYRVWGRETDGFVVMAGAKYGAQAGVTVVAFTARHRTGRAMNERAIEVLTAAGYGVTEPKSQGLGGDFRLYVTKAVAA